uniref:DUF4817 domain-containing protein n=1 Tax=Acrobeloides nanus TaxID=290746 RepID=A0A914DDR6_9BILA
MSSKRALSIIERAKLVCWFEETKSFAIVAKKYREQFHKEPPHQFAIKEWHKNFLETGSLDRSDYYNEAAWTGGFRNLEAHDFSTTTSRNPMV